MPQVLRYAVVFLFLKRFARIHALESVRKSGICDAEEKCGLLQFKENKDRQQIMYEELLMHKFTEEQGCFNCSLYKGKN